MPARPVEISQVAAADAPLAACAALIAEAYGAWAAPVALEKLTGPSPHGPATIWLARGGDADHAAATGVGPLGLAVTCGPYLRLLAVARGWRRRGVGSRLLRTVEVSSRATTLHVHAEPGNYLLPGVAADDAEVRAWLTRRGYRTGASCRNLEVALREPGALTNASLAAVDAAVASQGIIVALADEARRARAVAMIAGAFGAAWAHESSRARRLWVATNAADEPIGFAATGGNNAALGWFGPTGTLPNHRGRGVGTALLRAALRDLAPMQARTVIPWTDADDFYRKACGAQVKQHFVAMQKTM